jgi:hypothetical protein
MPVVRFFLLVIVVVPAIVLTAWVFAIFVPRSAQASEVLEVGAEPSVATGCQVNPKFPEEILQWCGLITKYATKFDVPPDLIGAVIWQESGGDPKAFSHSGAVGLMQVMPSDGIAAGFMCKNGPCFTGRPTTAELYDPEFNLKFGTKMLAGLIRKSNGDWREGLRLYGPMDVGYQYADIVLGHYQRIHSN